MTDNINTDGSEERKEPVEEVKEPVIVEEKQNPERKSILSSLTKEEAYREAARDKVSPELTKILIEKKNIVFAVGAILITGLGCFSLGVAFGASEASQLSHDRSSYGAWDDSGYGDRMGGGESYYEGYRQGFRDAYSDAYSDSRYQYPGWSNPTPMYPNESFGMTAEPPADAGSSAPAAAGTNPDSNE